MTSPALFRAHRERLVEKLRQAGVSGFAYLEGGVVQNRKWTDVELPFRQESNF